MTWLTVLGHRVDGRELGRAFAAHAGGRARAQVAWLCLPGLLLVVAAAFVVTRLT